MKMAAALAVQRPIAFVGAQDSHIAGILNKHGAGEIIPHGQPQKLATMIRNYLLDPTLWHRAHEGAASAAQNRRPEVCLEKWIKLIDEMGV